jgi:hypothetical protein
VDEFGKPEGKDDRCTFGGDGRIPCRHASPLVVVDCESSNPSLSKTHRKMKEFT